MHEKVTIGNAELWLGDCREILPSLPEVDLILTDPPYGIGRDGKRKCTSSHRGHKGYENLGWDTQAPPSWLFGLMHEKAKYLIIWGGNYYPQNLRPSMGWLVWDKGQKISQSDCELAYTNMDKALRSITMNRAVLTHEGAVHPTQKPVKLMEWCIDFADDTKNVCDPFMGSGSTGIASVKLGKQFIGIEREPKYFEIACKRIEHAVEQQKQRLFDPEPEPTPKPEPQSLGLDDAV